MKKGYKRIKKLGGFSRNIEDPYNKGFFTHLEVFVPKPDKDNPLPCILISIRNGHQKLFFRVASIDDITNSFRVPRDARVRLQAALVAANIEADQIEQDARMVFAKRHLAEGGKIVRTDTGEILAEAERIVSNEVS